MNQHSPFESAFGLHAAGSLAEAEIAYRRILATEPQHAEAQHYLGVLQHQRGRTPEGVSLILRALQTDTGSAARYNDLGNILSRTGDLDNAVTAFRLALQRNSDDANVWNNLGSVLHRQRLLADAADAYRQALLVDADFVPALNNLADLLAETGNEQESSRLWCQAFVQPPLAGKSPQTLGIAYYRLDRIDEAADCYRAWLSLEPDNPLARYHLAACTGQDVPARAPDAYVTALFNDMSESFDEKLVGKLSYRGPAIVAGLLEGYFAPEQTRDILDGGCGTGLCAAVLKPYARRLTGVDLSSGMLAKARRGGHYDELVNTELSAYLLERNGEFDLVVMADTLIYFGDLRALFAAVRQALRPRGMFAFTVEVASEPAQQVDYRLDASGRYGHTRRYLAQVLDEVNFAILRQDDAMLRSEFGKPTPGIGVLVRAM